MRPGLLGITDYVRIRTSQESTWIFLFWLEHAKTSSSFDPRPKPTETYMCALSQGNGGP